VKFLADPRGQALHFEQVLGIGGIDREALERDALCPRGRGHPLRCAAVSTMAAVTMSRPACAAPRWIATFCAAVARI
jgi:hypothetical protein